MTFNYQEFRQQFRAAAKARGIDPERGLTHAQYAASNPSSFQRVLESAELRADLHHSRMREGVRAAAQRQLARGTAGDEGSGLLKYDHESRRMVIDEHRVAQMESAHWWEYTELAKPKSPSHKPKTQREKLEDAGDAMRDVLIENPTQADMRAKKSQSQPKEVLNV